MLGLFLLGGITGALTAGIAVAQGASVLSALGLYVGFGMLLPIAGIALLHLRGLDLSDAVEDDPSFESMQARRRTNTLSDLEQWDEDPESQHLDDLFAEADRRTHAA